MKPFECLMCTSGLPQADMQTFAVSTGDGMDRCHITTSDCYSKKHNTERSIGIIVLWDVDVKRTLTKKKKKNRSTVFSVFFPSCCKQVDVCSFRESILQRIFLPQFKKKEEKKKRKSWLARVVYWKPSPPVLFGSL